MGSVGAHEDGSVFDVGFFWLCVCVQEYTPSDVERREPNLFASNVRALYVFTRSLYHCKAVSSVSDNNCSAVRIGSPLLLCVWTMRTALICVCCNLCQDGTAPASAYNRARFW